MKFETLCNYDQFEETIKSFGLEAVPSSTQILLVLGLNHTKIHQKRERVRESDVPEYWAGRDLELEVRLSCLVEG